RPAASEVASNWRQYMSDVLPTRATFAPSNAQQSTLQACAFWLKCLFTASTSLLPGDDTHRYRAVFPYVSPKPYPAAWDDVCRNRRSTPRWPTALRMQTFSPLMTRRTLSLI